MLRGNKMRDIYTVVEILNDVDGEKVTWESQEYSDYRTAHRIKTTKTKFNTNPDVKYELKLQQPESAQKSFTGMMK